MSCVLKIFVVRICLCFSHSMIRYELQLVVIFALSTCPISWSDLIYNVFLRGPCAQKSCGSYVFDMCCHMSCVFERLVGRIALQCVHMMTPGSDYPHSVAQWGLYSKDYWVIGASNCSTSWASMFYNSLQHELYIQKTSGPYVWRIVSCHDEICSNIYC